MSQIGPQLRVSQDAVKMLPIFPPPPTPQKKMLVKLCSFLKLSDLFQGYPVGGRIQSFMED